MSTKEIKIARGDEKAPLVLKNCRIVNVFNGMIEKGDIAIHEGIIAGVGSYRGELELDMEGKHVCPGFIDGHVHIESSLLTPAQFSRLVMPLGTTTIIADPHEIANVAGLDGIDYMLKASERTPLDVYIMLPSCVPSTDYEAAGAVLMAEDLAKIKDRDRVLGLGEMMNYPGVVKEDPSVISKLELMADGNIDGHAPLVTGKDLDAYVVAGVQTDHECTTKEELLEKVGKGMYIHIREGSATRNLDHLVSGITEANSRRLLFCTDDKLPKDILEEGHIDHNVRRAVELGINPITAIQMASLNIAECYGLKRIGAVAPGYKADLLVLSDLEKVEVEQVFKGGILVADSKEALFEPEALKDERVLDTVHLENIDAIDLTLHIPSGKANVIGLVDHEIITKALVREVATDGGVYKNQTSQDILKITVVERHKHTGNVAVGLVEGYGLEHGAIGLTISHDSHNVIVIGDNDEDIREAIHALKEMTGGMVIVQDGEVLDSLVLEVGGIMTDAPLEEVTEQLDAINELALSLGVSDTIDPFMTLAFLALPVIPELKMTDQGLFDVRSFRFVSIDAE